MPREAWGWAISHATTHTATHSANAAAATSKDPVERSAPAYDIDRLERAIGALVEENARLRGEVASLRHGIDQKAARVSSLEGELLEANQRRQDVAKRIDELIAQMDALDAQLAASESGSEGR